MISKEEKLVANTEQAAEPEKKKGKKKVRFDKRKRPRYLAEVWAGKQKP